MDTGNDLIEWTFKGLVTLIMTAGGWTVSMLIRNTSKTKDDLAGHKLHVAENYAKADSLERIHDRIDEVSADIKTLLQRRP